MDSRSRCAMGQDDWVIHEDVLAQLAVLPHSGERDDFIRFVSSAGDAALRRDGGPEHVTASCFVFTPDLEHTLLCFHRKGRFWVQLGGHIEAQDGSLAEAALREAREESAIHGMSLLSSAIVDLNRHELNSGFTCHAHWDVGFAAVAPADATITVSDESEDVRWFPVDALPRVAAGGLTARVMRTREAAAQLAS
jgi:8-oxo-dGTP pyrophosphatase MutT (NUDIX family)